MLDTLPKGISPAIQSFCASIAPGRPVWVQSRPDVDAILSFCFENVRQRVLKTGGRIVYGYAIWHLPNAYFEAEHHAVWEDPDGQLLDISPQYNDYPKILFLRDDAAVYDPGNFRPNAIVPESDHPLAQEIARTSLALNSLMNRYRIVGMPESDMTSDDQAASERLMAELESLFVNYQEHFGQER